MRTLWDEREIQVAGHRQGRRRADRRRRHRRFRAAMKPVYDKFLKDPKLQDMVKRVQDTK
jgi:TRAP-type C4-dicarboxylate transport system substrate-binding protein